MNDAPSLPSSPVVKAREVLLALHNRLQGENASAVRPDEFFPVRVEDIVSIILGWKLEQVETVGYRLAASGYAPPQEIHGETDKDSRTIRVSVRNSGPAEIRFTIAHEIGHVVMHSSELPPAAHRIRSIRGISRRAAMSPPSLRESREREADGFASALLMPERAVRARFKKQFGSSEIRTESFRGRQLLGQAPRRYQKAIGQQRSRLMQIGISLAVNDNGQGTLSNYFGVSPSAMAIRLCELRLVR